MTADIDLGLGLIGIGRPWGHRWTASPTKEQATALLSTAVESGVRLFDTAPAYGSSEAVLGAFLASLPADQRQRVFVSTKFGEHWDFANETAYTDHSYGALCRSLDRSMTLLQRIDLLQVHKASCEVLRSNDLASALQYARSLGIQAFGASVSTVDAAGIVSETDAFSWIQFPYNASQPQLHPVFRLATAHEKRVMVNRPFAQGRLLYERDGAAITDVMTEAFRFVIQDSSSGVVLTGTTSPSHLRDNLSAFRRAKELLSTERTRRV